MKITLARIALAAWLAWLLTLGIMACLSYARILHASFLYMAIPLVVQLICTVAVFGGGIWRMIRGPGRWNAAMWMLFGTLPTLWMGAYLEYLLNFGTGRNHQPNLLIYWAEAASSLIGEPYVRVCYPYRYEGERFVMWSDSPKCDENQMAAMDAHIRAMENSLGHRSDYKVYWVRGPVWGIGGKYVFGWALGSPSSTPADGTDGLNYLDRHEVAHFVLDQLRACGDHIEVPTLLNEGWAEMHSGERAESCRRQAWLAQREGELFSLRKLTNPEWYHVSAAPMYWQGSVVVDYLLRRFGHEKFLELCATCREASFGDDVKRVLGLSLDELDKAYQKDLTAQDSPDKRLLMSWKLADGVDSERWRRFIDDYCAGVEQLRTSFCQSSVSMVQTINYAEKNGRTSKRDENMEYYISDRSRARYERYSNGQEYKYISTPEVTFQLSKDEAGQPWRLNRFTARNRRIDLDAWQSSQGKQEYLRFPLHPLQYPLQWYSTEVATTTTITGINVNDKDSKFMRISYEVKLFKKGASGLNRGWSDLDPERNYGLVEAKFDYFDDKGSRVSSSHITVEYEDIDGNNVPKVARNEHTGKKGTVVWTDEIKSCRFGPPPAKVFELATYGDFQVPPEKNGPSEHIGILTWIASGCTLLGLLMASGLTLNKWRHRRY
jgi:hypothetical protein